MGTCHHPIVKNSPIEALNTNKKYTQYPSKGVHHTHNNRNHHHQHHHHHHPSENHSEDCGEGEVLGGGVV